MTPNLLSSKSLPSIDSKWKSKWDCEQNLSFLVLEHLEKL
jgi:hypothetical protein